MGADQPDPGLTTVLQEPAPCRWCGLSHGKLCPAVKAFEFQYTEDGDEQLVRVEFFAPIDYRPQKPEAPDGESYPRLKGMRDGS